MNVLEEEKTETNYVLAVSFIFIVAGILLSVIRILPELETMSVLLQLAGAGLLIAGLFLCRKGNKTLHNAFLVGIIFSIYRCALLVVTLFYKKPPVTRFTFWSILSVFLLLYVLVDQFGFGVQLETKTSEQFERMLHCFAFVKAAIIGLLFGLLIVVTGTKYQAFGNLLLILSEVLLPVALLAVYLLLNNTKKA